VGDVLPGNREMFGLSAALGGELVASPNGPGLRRTRLALDTSSGTSSRH
jgi:hypothetical protein